MPVSEHACYVTCRGCRRILVAFDAEEARRRLEMHLDDKCITSLSDEFLIAFAIAPEGGAEEKG